MQPSQLLRPTGLIPQSALRWSQLSLQLSRAASTDASSQLPIELPAYTIWGANTGVGKTLASVGLAHAAKRLQLPLLYIKPVQTGFPQDSDARLVAQASDSSLQLGQHAAHLVKPEQAALWSTSQSSQPASAPRVCKVVHAWAAPMSPHAAMAIEGRPVSDADVRDSVVAEVQGFMQRLPPAQPGASPSGSISSREGLVLVETAGGVASPAPSGRVMCDVLRPLRLPCLLVGDPRLGGISCTISAYESLLLRGYDVDVILLADPQIPLPDQRSGSGSSSGGAGAAAQYNNQAALRAHFADNLHRLGAPPVEVVVVPGCPPPPAEHMEGLRPGAQPAGLDASMAAWLKATAPHFESLVGLLQSRHAARTAALASARSRALAHIWWPFTQHAQLKEAGVQVIDSRWGEHWQVLGPASSSSSSGSSGDACSAGTGAGASGSSDSQVMRQLYDGCSSWWTQATRAEAQPEVARAVGYAAGRYLHAMFPENAHEAALGASERLLATVGRGWASRVFFSDNGSTAIEVALKMAFRKFMVDQGLTSTSSSGSAAPSPLLELQVVGLHNAYHGDTLGAQDCVAPSVFNAREQAPWYRGRGLFFDPPYLGLSKGSWRITQAPAWLAGGGGEGTGAAVTGAQSQSQWASLQHVLDASRDDSPLVAQYRAHIETRLGAAAASNAGAQAHLAALILEPLLQGAGGMLMVDPAFQRALVQACRARGLPVIFDEVMTGLYRVGALAAAHYLGVRPDIACYAKLMTAGTVPMAATLASEAVFDSFKGDSKLQALLHGHSYTAFPIGCAATVVAVDMLTSPTYNPNLCTPQGPNPTCPTPDKCSAACGRALPSWDPAQVTALSHHPRVSHVVPLGTVLAVQLASKRGDGAGYASGGAVGVVTRLRGVHGVYARPLGDVVYLMVPPTASRATTDKLLSSLIEALDHSMNAASSGAQGDGYVV